MSLCDSTGKSNGLCANHIYSYANSEDLRCNQPKDELFAEHNYENDENLCSSNETTDYDTIQGNPVYSPVSDTSFFEKQKKAPSSKNLVGKEGMGKLCSSQKTPEDSRVDTAQPQMEPEYAVLKGPDVYESLNNSYTGSGSHKYPQKQGSCDYDVI